MAWLAQTDSLEEAVQSRHGNIENQCWDGLFRGFGNSGCWVTISVSLNFLIFSRVFAQRDFYKCKSVVVASGHCLESSQ